MNEEYDQERLLRQYLLGELTAGQAAELEDRWMTDDAFFRQCDELMDVVEDELVEDCETGSLDSAARASFEARLQSSPRLRDKVLVARTLAHHARAHPPEPAPQSSWWSSLFEPAWRPAAVLAGVALFATLAGALWYNYSKPGAPPQVAQQPTQPVPASAFSATAFVLSPGLVRGAGAMTRIPITSETRTTEVCLDIGIAEFSTYRIEVLDAQGARIAERTKVGPVSIPLVCVPLVLSDSALIPGDYTAVLYGEKNSTSPERLDAYSYRILRPAEAPQQKD